MQQWVEIFVDGIEEGRGFRVGLGRSGVGRGGEGGMGEYIVGYEKRLLEECKRWECILCIVRGIVEGLEWRCIVRKAIQISAI